MAKPKQTSGPKLTSYLELDYTRGWRYVNLRMPIAILDDLDQHLSGQQPKGQRMHWIIQAIIEKLEREQRHSGSHD